MNSGLYRWETVPQVAAIRQNTPGPGSWDLQRVQLRTDMDEITFGKTSWGLVDSDLLLVAL